MLVSAVAIDQDTREVVIVVSGVAPAVFRFGRDLYILF